MASTYPRRLLIAGAGEHACVVVDLLLSKAGITVVGLTDVDERRHGDNVLGVPILGSDQIWPALRADGVRAAIAAVGENDVRRRLAQSLKRAGFELVTAIHDTSSVSAHTRIGAGSVVMAGALINARTDIDENVVINTGAIVEHDCIIARDAHVGPGAKLGGRVRVGEQTLVGIGATVLPGITIGDGCVIGAGAVVVQDVADGATVVGVPAKVRAFVDA